MATKTIKHEGEDLTIKTVKEDVLGLKIDDMNKGGTSIPNAFGWEDEKSVKFMDTFKKFRDFQFSVEELNEDLPKGTKVTNLVDFLKSDSFKKLDIKISTPNDYFMLGFTFAGVVSVMEAMKLGSKIGGGIVNGNELLELIKKLKKDE